MSNKIIIELQSKDNATGQIITKVKALEGGLGSLERSGNKAFAGLEGSLGGAVAGFGKLATAVGVASAAMAAFAFKEAIKGIEDFNQKTINIASQLTNMAAEGQGSFKEMFERNLAYAQGFYDKLRGFDAERASSLEEMMTVYNSLVTQGYAVRMDEAEALSKITDLIKQKTAGQNFEVQAMQEVRSLLDGQANANSRIAQELKSRLGPAWEEIVKQHREAGTLLDYLNSLYPGIAASSEKMQQTLEAQSTTLKSQLLYIGREGLGGAYDDIVKLLDNINDYLKEHADTLIPKLERGWTVVRDIIEGAYGFVKDISGVISTITKWTIQIAFTPGEGDKKIFNFLNGQGELPFAFGGQTLPTQAESDKRHYDAAQQGILEGYGGVPTKAQMEALGITATQTRGKASTAVAVPGAAQMNKAFMERLQAMAERFKELTGETLKVTDGFRTFDQQVKLRREKGAWAAVPGTSMHEKGLAVDIDSAQAKKIAQLGLFEEYGLHRPYANRAVRPEPWHVEMIDYAKKTTGSGGANAQIKEYEQLIKAQERLRKKDLSEQFKDVADSRKMVEETYNNNRELYKEMLDSKKQLDQEYKDWNVNALQEIMSDESLSYQDRLAAGEEFKAAKIAQVEEEIQALRDKYGSRISEDTLIKYQQAQVDQINRTMGESGQMAQFWESAWKRAAENVQDALSDTIYNLLTQTKSAEDMLKNLFQGFARILSDMAAQTLMNLAKTGLQSMGGGGGGGGGGSGFLGGLFGGGGGNGFLGGMFGGLFGSGTASIVGDVGVPIIDDMIGGMGFTAAFMAKGGVLPGGFTPIAQIPQFAGGGVFDRPTLGIIGERGPEAVVPLDQYDRGGSGNYQISVAHSPTYNYRPTAEDYKRDARMIVNCLDKELRTYSKRTARNFVRM